jgi:hypothetical protein
MSHRMTKRKRIEKEEAILKKEKVEKKEEDEDKICKLCNQKRQILEICAACNIDMCTYCAMDSISNDFIDELSYDCIKCYAKDRGIFAYQCFGCNLFTVQLLKSDDFKKFYICSPFCIQPYKDKIIRLIWAGALKNNIDCHLSKLPNEIIRKIVQIVIKQITDMI